MEDVLIEGRWQAAEASGSFTASNPATGERLREEFPTSSWSDCDRALNAAVQAFCDLQEIRGAQIATFLAAYADLIESRAEDIVAAANTETALPVRPRLRDVELPRTTTQLRRAAAAAAEGSWTQAVLDTKNNIRSHFAPLGPVVVFGPNNFPFAFNGIAGGDFAAAIATGCPVIAKAHPLHPATSRALAQCAVEALEQTRLPSATVQMLYHLGNEEGLRLVADSRVGASSFTGSRSAGLRLKAAAEKAGRLIYLEMSSLNPIVFLPGALKERLEALIFEAADSGLAAAGQFCTSPNLFFLTAGPEATKFTEGLSKLYAERVASPLLSEAGLHNLGQSIDHLQKGGATVLTGASPVDGPGFRYRNTVLQCSGEDFLKQGDILQQEAFGNASTVVLCRDSAELHAALGSLEGNLTGAIYSSTAGADDAVYNQLAPILREKVGRLLNDKMPTGVALSPAMNHGGPYPSTSHPGFTAVGIPRSMQRFCALHCYDNVRNDRLPLALRDHAPSEAMWRSIDGRWTLG